MSTHAILELVHRYFDALAAGDRRSIEGLLTPDFSFTSPTEDLIDRATYVERCEELAGSFEYHDLKCTFVSNDACVALYESKSKTGTVRRNVELLRFKGDRLASVEVFTGRPPYLFTDVRWSEPSLPLAFTPSGV